ncbi:MAG TPA: helix-turn-helix transcriptional regulator [Streptosporangiaceae bacterium]|nr:helix-turn-helix transcriptional regulator [Streptosporangiaceae bacterium]
MELARAMRAMRESTGLPGTRFADRLGWPQSRLSKLETGRQFPSEDDVRAWAQAASVDPAELLALRERAREEYGTWREQYRIGKGAAGKQADIGQLEADSSLIVKFQPVMIPSQVQTAQYARELLRSPSGPLSWGATDADVEGIVGARMHRQQILYEPGKTIRVVILEAALQTRLTSREAMTGQLDRMLSLEGLPSLSLGIVPFRVLVPVYPLSGFVVFDDQLVVVETVNGEHQLSDPDDVKRYGEWFGALDAAAVHGREATELIRGALAALAAA